MKDSIAQERSAFNAELFPQTSENITNINDASSQIKNTKNILKALTLSELFWYERLAALQPLQLPFETAREQAEPRWAMSLWQSPLPKNGEEDPLRTLLQTFVIYLARLTQQTEFQIGWGVKANDNLTDLAPVVPMDVEVAFDKPWRAVADWIENELAQLVWHQTFSHDFLIRFPSLQAMPVLTTRWPWQIAVSMIQDDKQSGQKVSGELLTLQVNAQGGFRWIYDENRLNAEVVLRMSEHLQVLALSKRQGEEIPVGQLNVLPEAERRLLLETWNATENPYPDPLCIHQLFEQQVELVPQATALEYQEQILSYAELNTRANRLAHQLIALGVTPDQRVAICVERSPAMVVALLAVLKAGGAYVPLDSTYPGERLVYILNDTAPAVVLADATGLAVLGDEALAGLTVLDPNIQPDRPDSNPQVPALTPQHLAYVIYTSGSTGQPKGVMVEHQAIYQRYLGFNETYAVTAQDRLLQFAAFAFDVSVEDFFSSLCNGATLVLRDDSWLASIAEFITLTRQYRITVVSLPTLFWSELAARDSGLPLPDCLRLIIIGGEAVKKNAIQDWFRQEGHRPRLLNGYGPTENVVTVTYKDVLSPADAHSIGRPAKNARIYLLDQYGQPVPLGCVGEMYIGGVGVARGYLNRPALSTERFILDPFSPVAGARMYRSGDLARYLPDGDLSFLGRNDEQVKIRGFRIELGEIETRLLEHSVVQEAAVLALDGEQGKRLVAYVVAAANEGLASDLRAHLSAILPDYMVPAAFVRLESFPQTPNGKLDRRALPEPGEDDVARQIYEAPQGETEIAIAALWRELLGIEQISRHDSFFALGGHSLLGVQMIERLRSQGLTLAARDLFQSPVLSALAQTLGRHQAVIVPPNIITPATTALTPTMLPLIDLTQPDIDHIVGQVPGGIANIQDIYTLSPLQDGILFHHILEKEGDPYLVLYPVAFANRALLDRYLDAVQQVVDRHDILRTAFIWEGLSVPAQVVWRQATLPVTELTLDPADGPVIDQLTRRFDPDHYRLDLRQAPLLHFVIAQETDGRWFLLELQHHLIGDHETMEVMHREVQAFFAGQGDRLPAPVPFRNLVAEAQLGVSQAAHTRFFTDMLAAVEEPTLPFGLTDIHRDGSQKTESHRMLTAGLNDRLRSQARRLGVSLATLCHLAWARVLSCTSGQAKVVFGTVLFGRMAVGEGADSSMGLFINTLPLRLDIDETPVRDSVRAVHLRLAGLLAHEHASLALAQRCSGVACGTPLFSALLNYRHNVQPDPLDETMAGIEFLGEQERTNYPFVLSVEDGATTLGLTAQVVQPFDPESLCDYMQQALESLVEALEQAPETPVRALEILPEAERTLLLKTWNATETAYPDQLCIHQLFELQVEKTPKATALIAGDKTLSYTELNASANRLARQLIEQGIHPDDHVAILLERSIELVVAQLAILKVGAVYVPIDPSVPDERKNWLISDCSARLLLTDTRADIPANLTVSLLRLSDETDLGSEEDDINPGLPRSSAGSAYIMYTSGSTGMPKGVVVPHRGVVRLVINNGYAEIGPDDRVAFTANPAFDASTFEVWAPLLNGGALVVIDHATLLTPQELVPAFQTHRITVLWLTIGLFNRLAAELSPVFPQIKILIFGGDIPDLHVIAQVLDNRPPQQLLQAYGPSEGTTFTTIYPIVALAQGVTRIPIGRPIANTRVYLLDAYEQPVPPGVIGEIYVGGDGVAQGYFNRPELTAERFLVDPFSDNPNARMYRSGDLARYLPDGNLEFLSRNDQQVKIRGFRIEPGEIEACLAEHPTVHEVAVLAQGEGPDKRLVAYVVAPADDGLVNSLRAHLSAILPDYMVPSAFVRLDAFPLTPNGKLDRRALPAPDNEAFAYQVYEAPQGETEIALAAIWCELLGIEQVSRHDSFFALGGHSLLAIRMVERLRHLGLTLTARDLFQFPVLFELARSLGQHQAVTVPPNVITPADTTLTPAMLPLIDLTQTEIDRIVEQVPGGIANIQDIYALSPLQDGILFHHLLANEGDPYLLTGLMAFTDRSLLDRYLAAVQRTVDRHDILRTAFIWQGLSVPAQVVWRQAQLSVTELTLNPVDGPVSDQLTRRFDPHHHRLDLGEAPLLRFVVAQETDGRWIALQLLHHLIGDHETMEVMHREVQAHLRDQADSLPAPVPFRNLVAQARLGVSQEAHTRFFTDMLAAVDEPTLPFGLAEVHRDGSQVTEFHRMLAPELNDRLRSQARRLGVSLAALCHLAWAQVLSRTSGQEKVVFGTVLFGRMQAGDSADNGMGLFINTLPLQLDIDETPVRDSVQAAHTRLAGLLAHEHASLALAQRCSGITRGTPLFSALLNYRHNVQPDPLDETMDGIEFLSEQERTNYPFVLSVEDFAESLGLTAQVVQPFDPERIYGYMQQALESLVAALEQAPDMPVRVLETLPEAERTLLLKTWNATETVYPDALCIHQLFEQQVAKTPEATALVAGEKTLSYRELNACANRLARQLIEQGVYPGDPVALLLERSVELVVAQLAILKAGGVYVPIDPRVPDERKNWLISDCSTKLLLTDTRANIPANLTVPLLRLFGETDLGSGEDDINPSLPRSSAESAYIMYTSGSTGMPKGVVVPHRAVARLVINNGYAEIGPGDRVAFAANPVFDASTFEVWAPLLNGGALVVVDHVTLLTPLEFVQVLRVQRMTVLWLSVGLFNQLAAELSPVLPQIKLLIVGGDALDPHVIGQVLSTSPPQQLLNGYGPSEGTTFTATYRITALAQGAIRIPIGRPVANTRVYLLDAYGRPVPLGVVGEIYVGGDGVACGYLNRPELTAKCFLVDPFSDNPDARMYRTGDLARYLPDGNLEFLGRNDQQVKIRGFRIEPGEIEARLAEHPAVREVAVLVWGEGEDKRLVAYVVAPADEGLMNSLRAYLSTVLPDYMVPSAFVRLAAFPLTPNGKLDRRALPAPDGEAVARQVYAPPQGETEIALSVIWRELLGVEQVSRHDSFFALGGHSLLAVRMIERLRHQGLTLTARDLFQSPVLSALAQTLGRHHAVMVPANVITPETTTLTPAMLPLIDLTQPEIDSIIEQVPGGMANLQDIYALSPLQDGILFHHLLANEGDPYLLVSQMVFADRPLLDRYLAAVQQMVDRHDILRTAFIWQGLSVPAQVVWRQAQLSVTELTLNPADGSISDQLTRRFDPRHHRLDLGKAPLLRFVVAQETDGRWLLLELLHHLIGDHTTLDVMNREVQACLTGQEDGLPAPVPFRNLVAQARLGISQEEHTHFFTNMLAAVAEPTLPFGLANVHHDGSQEMGSYRMLTTGLNDRLRYQARHLGVSLAALCHLAWAQVLSHTSGQEKVVFGTVLFGRMAAGEGADSGMGLFINTLPLRLDIDDTPVRDSVRAAHLRLAGLLAHEHASLALAQRCSGVASGTPLFSALLNYRHNDQQDPLNETMAGIEFLGGQESTNYPFGLSVEDGGSTLGLTASAVQPFDPDRICGYMQQALESLVAALEQAPETPVRALNILPETERTLLLETWNETETPYPEALCIHQLFEQQVARAPEATALAYQAQTFSYGELNACANRLAHQLIALGVTPDQPVAICVERSPAMVVGLLAVLKAGGAYVPLDSTYPGERLAYILNDTAPAVVLADAVGRAALGEAALAGLTVLDPNTLPDLPDSNPQVPALTPQHLAYVIYTSGSTGQPKGVMVEHQAIYQRYLGFNETYAVTAQDRVLQFASFSFDVSVEELFSSLCNGATLVIRDDSWLTSMQEFITLLRQNRITVISLPTLFWSELVARDKASPLPDCIKLIIIGGEAVQKRAIQVWFIQETYRPRLLNTYGPTENTVTATCKAVLSPGDDSSIGRPVKNTCIYLLDQYGQPVPLGCIGEMYIGGVGVARGYLNQPELSAERFILDPFSPLAGARMYRTGDLARYLPDGDLAFLGRNDQQVKIRGFRIELGEIETRLLEYPAVQEAAVLVREDGQDKRLVAYVVAAATDGLVARLREHLSAILPDYMIPAAFVRLESFPQTPNGKQDRRALPAPDEEAFARQVYEAPQGEVEIALAAIWCEVLGIEQISRHDNFFALGGHSLLAVRMMNRIALLGIELPLSVLFEASTLMAFAGVMRARFDEQHKVLPSILPISREGELPLSFAQQRLWFLAQFEGVSDIYHLSMALRLCGQLDIVAWQQALDTLFARHEALRSVFVSVDGQPQVQLLAADSGVPLSQYDLRGIPDAETRLEHLSIGEASTSFDLSHGPLIRASLIRISDDEYRFLLTQHHIVSDGWSVGVLISELSTLYTAFLAGQPAPLPPLAIQYPDYAAWQRQWLSVERVQAQSDYWRTMLADAPVLLDLPTDRPRPPQQSFTGGVMFIDLDAELTASLKHLSEQQGVTLFMTLLSAWAMVLSRLSGQEDLVIGTPSAGRSHQEVEPLIGFFVNTLALRIDLSGAPDVIELLARVRQTALAAQAHQDLPFEQVVEIVQPPRRLAHTPLFQVMFAWQNNESPEWELPELAVSLIDSVLETDTVKFDLELELSEENGRIVGSLGYATALFDQQTIERYVGYLHTVLQAMVVHPQQPVGEIDILAPAERRLLLETWNATETAYPDPLCIHQLFEQQVQRTPNATALVCGAETLSYAELNRRANRLAHELIAQGVIPEQRVALCVSRSASMMIGLLAILKAGGAYVPLDPAYSGDRLSGILSDATPVMVVADAMGRTALGQDALKGLKVLEPDTDWVQPDSNPQVLSLNSRQLAYVIYTSGTTGVPKGVMVEHRGVINLAIDHIDRLGVKPDSRVLQFASMSFDASVADIVMAYGAGAALHILSDDVRYDRNALWHYLDEQRITHLTLPPAVLQNAHELPPLQTHLTLILAGEALGSALLQSLAGRYNTFNIYGPTEATVAVMSWHCPPDYQGEEIPIGRPINNTRIYLLDARGQPVPQGAVGELYIGGAGIARGYLNRPDLTAERFLDDPFSVIPGARMYRTGDLARYLPEGNLVYVGRNDQQVKIRGFRIEPGEIEARLMEYPSVRESLVVTDGKGEDKRLVAYVVADDEEELAQHLRSHLSTRLPEYMIPPAFVRLDAFPLTRNGKLDRRGLPAPDEKAVARQVYAAPRGETEIALADIWRELLGIEQVSRHDNFFALGGHSLLAIRMVNLVASQGLICTLNALFQFPVLSELAAKITSDLLSQPQTSAISVRPGGTELPLFFVPSGMEDYSYVYGLAQHIRSDYPVYTLPWPSISEEPMSTMEEHAARMINLMKAVQPAGPYRLAGYSSGGILAYAVAQWLLHAGETVNFLGLIDTPAPHDVSEEPVQLNHLFFAALVKQFGEEHTDAVVALYRRIDELNLVQFIEAAQELALYPASLRPDLVAKRWEQGEHYIQIVEEYEPQALAVTLHQFYAMELSPPNPFVADEELKPLTMDPSLGWGRVMPDSLLQLIAVPGNHASLMENKEHRIALAQALNRALAMQCDEETL
ncbi:amino acid adenylation domain-containing protein [Photorhabdus sp. SF281]|uniref:amino acid adenylation domain-containing protein n=1 Tax=Photorhabdus sp. SF281 TaxID=3459527 RepID=UPI0040448F76